MELKTVCLFRNGMLAVFDTDLQQVPDLQGRLDERGAAVCRAAGQGTEILLQTRTGPRPLTREEFLRYVTAIRDVRQSFGLCSEPGRCDLCGAEEPVAPPRALTLTLDVPGLPRAGPSGDRPLCWHCFLVLWLP
jgi:hypothetical protein